MAEAFAKLEKDFGSEKAVAFQQAAKDLINGDAVVTEVPTGVMSKKRRFGFFGKKG